MSKVLLVVAHPDLSQSKANAALVDAVRDLPHVTVHDLYATYPDFQIDADAEQALLAEHDVIVFQHPVYWYNTTPLLKQWQDKVFTHGWAFTMDGSPSQLSCTAHLSAFPTRTWLSPPSSTTNCSAPTPPDCVLTTGSPSLAEAGVGDSKNSAFHTASTTILESTCS
jgi:putative NADPH-quinone reductase